MASPICNGQILHATDEEAAGTLAQVALPRQAARAQILESWVTDDGANNKFIEVRRRDLQFPISLGQTVHITGTNIETHTTIRDAVAVPQPAGIGVKGADFVKYELSKYATAPDNTAIAGVNRTFTEVSVVPVIDWVAAWALGATAQVLEVYFVLATGSPIPIGGDWNAAGNQRLVANKSWLGGIESALATGSPYFRSENVPNFAENYFVSAQTDAAAAISLRVGYHYEAVA